MTDVFSINFNELDISAESIYTVLGYSNESLRPLVNDYIDEVFGNCGELFEINGGYRIIEDIHFTKDNFLLHLDKISLNIKKIVFQQINKSTNIAVFACTAGNKIYEISRKFMTEGDFLRGYVYDVFGSLVVEEAMDRIQESLRNKMAESGLKISNRYSPGYCGWNVSEQQNLFKLLPDDFCGISLTESCLMLPIKSVSGIIGIGKSIKFNPYICEICDSFNCLYRNLRNLPGN